jgi:hypothetical protein
VDRLRRDALRRRDAGRGSDDDAGAGLHLPDLVHALNEQRTGARRLLREPLLHFALIGGLLFAVGLLRDDSAAEAVTPEVVVTEGRVLQITETFRRTWRRDPTAAELRRLIDEFVTEELLAREAAALGLGADDTIIRRRLRQKMDFLLDDLAAAPPPAEAELEAHLAARLERFRPEPLFSFRQVYIDVDRLGAAAARQAAETLDRLRGDEEAWRTSGADLLLVQRRYEELPLPEVRSLFGPRFAESLDSLEPERWSEPLPSGYGLHLVYLERRTHPDPPTLEEAREAVLRDWERSRREEAVAQAVADMRGRYRVRIDMPESP